MDKRTTAFSLAKQIKYECEGEGSITLEKATLRIIIDALMEEWCATQAKVRNSFEKVK